jgi:hypothetical protein
LHEDILAGGYDKNEPISSDGGAMRARVGLVFVLVTLAISACGQNSTPNQAGDQPGQSPSNSVSPAVSEITESPRAKESPSRTAQASNVLIEYGRQGGLRGADDRLVIKRDGTYTLTRRNQPDVAGKLTAAQLDALQKALAASRFESIPRVNKGNTITDGYTYRVVYQGREVLAEDGGVPPALEQVIDALNVVLSRA